MKIDDMGFLSKTLNIDISGLVHTQVPRDDL